LASSASEACERLIEAANERGAPDNVTTAVARVTGAVSQNDADSSRLFGALGALARALGRGGSSA
jgi:hypothetical protein